jgi:hypothetical protein
MRWRAASVRHKGLGGCPDRARDKISPKAADAPRILHDRCPGEFDFLLTSSIFIAPPEQGKRRLKLAAETIDIVIFSCRDQSLRILPARPALCFSLLRFRSFSLYLTAARGKDCELFAAANRVSNVQSLM